MTFITLSNNYIMKYISLFLLLVNLKYLQAQEVQVTDSLDTICATLSPDSLTSVHLAYFANNEVLDSVLVQVGYYHWLDSIQIAESNGKTHVNTNSNGYLFNVPITVWDYHDDDGSNEAYPEDKILQALEQVNRLYHQNHVGIRFFLACPIIHVNNTEYNHVSGYWKFAQMVTARKNPTTLNWHMVSHPFTAGAAISPFFPQNYSFFIGGQGSNGDVDIIDVAAGTAHEIGHTLGLFHTFMGGITAWWDNDNIPGILRFCFQESANHSRMNIPSICGGGPYPKCMANGDFLCDTKGDIGSQYHGFPECERIKIIQDFWGDDFPTEPRNIMSYIDNECKQEFTTMQIGVMYQSLLYYPNNTYGIANVFGWWLNGIYSTVYGTADGGDVVGVANYYLTSPKPNHTYIVKSGADVLLVGGNSVDLRPGTDIQKGALFHANIDLFWRCIDQIIEHGGRIKNPNISASDSLLLNKYQRIRSMIDVSIENRDKQFLKNEEYYATTNVSQKIAYIYPNPFYDGFTLFCSPQTQNDISVILYNSVGEIAYRQNVTPDGLGIVEYEIYPNIAEGVYYYQIEIDRRIEYGRIVKIK